MNELSELEIESSAALFESLHALLEEQKASHGDRRGDVRRAYECFQLLAFYDGCRAPAQGDFRCVLCHDLSPGGFSFLAEEAPRLPYVIIALGSIPFTFFVAQVLRVRPAGGDGGSGCLVACRFLRRVAASSDLLNLDSVSGRSP